MTIDELIVKLTLDAAGLKQGSKDAQAAADKLAAGLGASAERGEKAQAGSHKRTADGAVRMGKAIAESNAKVSQSFEGVLRTGLAFLALFTGARTIEDFTRKMVALDASVGRMAHNVGSSPERVSALAQAVARSGGTFEGATSAIQGLSDAYQELITTGSTGIMEPISRLQALGGKSISLGNDWHKTILQVADDLKILDKTNPQLADTLGRQIYKDPALTNLAKGGSEAILAAEARAQQHGVITKEQAEAAQKAQAAWTDLNQSVTSFGNTLVTDLEPDITAIINKMDDWIVANKFWVATDIKQDIEAFAKLLSDHQTDIRNFGGELLTVVSIAGQIAAAFAAQGPAAQAIELFAALIGTKLLGSVNLLRGALGLGLLNPAVLGTAAVAGVLASGDPKKALLSGGRPDENPRNDDLGLPGLDSDKDLPENRSPSDPSRPKSVLSDAWSWIKTQALAHGFGDKVKGDSRTKDDQVRDDPRVRDDISEIAKATGQTRDILKAQQDAAGGGVTVSSGGIGGSGQHFGGGSSPGASLGDRSGFRGSASANGRATVAEGLTPEARALLDTLASGEAKDYNIMNGGGTFSSYADHPGGRAAGRYQFLPSTWRGIKKETGLEDFSPANQDKGAWYLARRDYRLHTGRDLQTDLASKDPARIAGIGQALHPTWVSTNSSFAGKYANYFARDGVHPNAQAPVPAGTSEKAIGDAEAFAAHQRIVNGSRDGKDRALYDRYLQQQNTPKPAHGDEPMTTVDRRDPRFAPKTQHHHQTIRDALDILRDARKLTHHDGQPIKVSLDRASLHRVATEHLAMLAAAQRGALHHVTTNNVDRSSETKIAELHVHSRATDAASIARDTHAALIARREAADKGNYGLA